MGMPPRHDHERILELHRKGLDTVTIARRVGCSTRVVRYVLKTKGKEGRS
ncbi:MAG: hypothetical protein IKG69_11400 [Atopobiaceae bacterium]|nr:hypothetical protein [Atopobiaceae bacterium]